MHCSVDYNMQTNKTDNIELVCVCERGFCLRFPFPLLVAATIALNLNNRKWNDDVSEV